MKVFRKKCTKMKKSPAMIKQEENYWAELYSAKLIGFIEGFVEGFKEGYKDNKEGEKFAIEWLIKDGSYNLNLIACVLELPSSEIAAIKRNMNVSVS
jgi:hypothetical protein